MSTQSLSAQGQGTVPIVVDLGKVRPKQVRALKRGEGKLMTEVAEVMAEVRAGLGGQAEGKDLVPVVLVYRKKAKRGRGLGFSF